MATEKAGCFLIKKETREIALIYRQKQEDYSFPKGHIEKGETLKETADKINCGAKESRKSRVLEQRCEKNLYSHRKSRNNCKHNEPCKAFLFDLPEDEKTQQGAWRAL